MEAVFERVKVNSRRTSTCIFSSIPFGVGGKTKKHDRAATVDGNYWISLLLPSFIASLGNALAYLPATTASVAEVESEKSGLASGLYNVNFQIGSAIGLAIMVAVAASTTDSSTAGNSVVALNESFQQAFFWAGILAFVGAVLAIIFVRSPKQGKSNHSQ
ncbi:MFS transporter [Virgibacillus dakarensis]|uniref:MFS transporter n=1 Tax=Virgibacillus dakarensis TaxID=1917889 RepID=UPI000B43C18A|nr:MFS transporter [Virgibacillus dakarensis]MTW86885.1 MFS transporter [Virgibacillus dakarensis]